MATMEPKKAAWEMGAAPKALGRWLTLAPSITHYMYVSHRQHYGNNHTYAKEEGRNTSGNGQHKDKRDDHRRARVADLEDVVDPSSGTVSYGSGVLGSGSVGIETDLDFEEGRDEGVGRAKRTKHEVGLDGGVGEEELDGEILLRLEVSVSHAIDSETIQHTKLTVPFPDVFILRGKGASRPVSSFRMRKAW